MPSCPCSSLACSSARPDEPGLSLADALAKLRGPAGAAVKLRLIHEGESGAGDLDVVRGVRHPTPHAARPQVAVEDGHLVAEATGSWAILEFEPAKSTPLMATSAGEFVADDEDRSRIAFVRDAAGKVTGLVLNPGPWQRKAALIPAELR